MRLIAIALLFAMSVVGCVTHQTQEGSRVRVMTDFDIPRCDFIAKVSAGGHWYIPVPYTPDADIDDSFNDLLNEVASVGGDAYLLRNPEGYSYNAEAWNCEWKNSFIRELTKPEAEPQEIFSEERTKCKFLKTFTEASYWGMTHKRNRGNAIADALNEVRELGGDSYFIAHTAIRQGSGMHVLIIEAYLCHSNENTR